MSSLLGRLGTRQRKGSKPRCHWLTHGTPNEIAARLSRLIEPWGKVAATDRWMPEGFDNTDEAELHDAPRLLAPDVGQELHQWWLSVVRSKTRTPNWDIASTCTVTADGKSRAGLLLIEAKAHTEELNKEEAGKVLTHPISESSRRNHDRIAASIQEANLALGEETGFPWVLSRDWNYQMSNRFAWSWKLAELGFSVILVYLGYLDAREMDKGSKQKHFADHSEWAELVVSHSELLFPAEVWGSCLPVHGRPFVPLIRSASIPYDRPCETLEVYA